MAWFRRAAEQGDPDAMCVLGLRYESGARAWSRTGAPLCPGTAAPPTRGSLTGMCNLAWCCERAWGW